MFSHILIYSFLTTQDIPVFRAEMSSTRPQLHFPPSFVEIRSVILILCAFEVSCTSRALRSTHWEHRGTPPLTSISHAPYLVEKCQSFKIFFYRITFFYLMLTGGQLHGFASEIRKIHYGS